MDGRGNRVTLLIALLSAACLFGCASFGNKALEEEDSASIEK